MRSIVFGLCLAVAALPALAQGPESEGPVPQSRLAIAQNFDYYGADLAQLFDTTLDACQAACLADSQCVAFTFNQRSGACFPKSEVSEVVPFAGAISGRFLPTDPAVLAAAPARAADLGFLETWEIEGAANLARTLGREHSSDEMPSRDLIAAAKIAEARGDMIGAFRLTGAAISLTDSASQWRDYARLGLVPNSPRPEENAAARSRVLPALINAYLRSDQPDLSAAILLDLAAELEAQSRGPLTVPALRLAAGLDPSRGTAAALDRAIGLYGFRVAEVQVESDSATPRLCVVFTEPLDPAGVDYAPFVSLPDVPFTVAVQDSKLCLDGVLHGERYRFVLREGLPSARGETLARSTELTAYVRDRSPQARFVSRAYVLPRAPDAALPIETVNLSEVALTLSRMTDRNILRAMDDGLFARNLYEWDESWFDSRFGTEIWSGTAEVANRLNQDVLTRLPLAEAIAGQPPGVYVLTAKVPGADPYLSPAASQWFILSDLGISSAAGTDGLTVGLRSLGTAAPLAGAEVELLSRANEVLATAVSDAEGLVNFAPGLLRGTAASEPALILARLGDDLGFLSLTDPAFDLSDRGVEGRDAAPPIDAFLATDRGAYRAGETIHLTALLRDPQALALPGVPVTAILRRPDGVEYSRQTSTLDVAGGHVFALPVAASAPRGTWSLEVAVDPEAGPIGSRAVLVEDFLPERIDVTLTPPVGATLAVPPQLELSARYLFGAPAGNLPIEGDVTLRAASGLADWPGYVFGRADEPFFPLTAYFGDATTDEAGLARVELPYPLPEAALSIPFEAEAALRVSEGSGRPVERRVTFPVQGTLPLIGIKPAFDGMVEEGGEAQFDLIALAPDLRPTTLDVVWTINRVETEYQWFNLNGDWQWEPTVNRTRIATGTATLGESPLRIGAVVDWGAHELVVETASGEYLSASVDFDAGWYASPSAEATPDLLEVGLDRESYAPGDVAELRIVPREAGLAMITVMTDRVVHRETREVLAGASVIPLTVTEAWGTGAYLSATVIRPMDVAAGRNPARALGLVHATVEPGDKALSVVIEAPLQADPRGPLTVAADVSGLMPGEAGFVTLAAVDVGILNLTGFTTPDPQGHYFGQRKLGVELRDVYGQLIDGLSGDLGALRQGGDGMAQMGMQSPPPTEDLVAFFSGPIAVDAEGRAEITLDLPAFNGTVRVFALAWSARGVGSAEADVIVRDPVALTASLPRFLAPGDESRLLVELVHAEGPAGPMGLSVRGSDGIVLAAEETVTLAAGGAARLEVPVTALSVGDAEVTVDLTLPDGRVLSRSLTLPVRLNEPEVARTSRLTLDPGASFVLDDAVFAGMDLGSASATLSVGPLARFDAAGLLVALDRYPYGCTEQMTSQAMPLLYFADVAAALDLADPDDVDLRIADAIQAILANQSANGSFGLWGPGAGDLWLNAYVTDFLARARDRGHAVPDLPLRAALDNLRNAVNYYPDFESGGEDLAYALMVLAREGEAAVGDLRYFADERGTAFSTPLAAAQMGAALAQYGDQPRADRMFAQAQAALGALWSGAPEAAIWRIDYGSWRRDSAAVLALAVEAGSNAVDRDLLSARIAGAGEAVSTQEAAWSLMAADALIDDLRDTDIRINGAAPSGPLVRLHEGGGAPVKVTNGGTAATELTVTSFGIPTEPEPAGGNGYAITREYFTLDGQPADLSAVPAGTRLVAVLGVQPFGYQAGRLMVSDPLPAGFEIDNPNLLRGGDIGALSWLETAEADSAQFRADRFLAAVTWQSDQPFRLAYVLRAVSPGSFRHPAASVEDMYRPQMRARTAGGLAVVLP